jgi:hypothetical protein
MRTKLLFLSSTLVSAVAAAPLGCGSLDGHTGTRGTLATVEGSLVDPSNYGVNNDVRVAVVWRNLAGESSSGGVGYSVSVDLPVQPVFPSSFVVQIDEAPPAAALYTAPGIDVPVAQGVVVAYEDVNGDGKLDLVPSNAGAFVDRIVGANENLYLVYIGGPVPAAVTQNSVGMPTSGYNLVLSQSCGSPGGSGSSGGGSSSSGSSSGAQSEAGVTANDGGSDPDGSLPDCRTVPPAEWLPMTHPYDLTVSSDPKVNQIMCETTSTGSGSTGGGTGWDVSTQGTPPGGYPSRADPHLTCHGSTEYIYQQGCVTVQQAICGPAIEDCTYLSVYFDGATPPQGWPCP